jgi:hypothetical protein
MGIGVWWKNGSWRVVVCGLKVELEQPDKPVGIVRAQVIVKITIGVSEEVCNSHINTGVEE